LGRLEYQYGEQHSFAAGLDQHHDRLGRWHEPVAPGNPGADHAVRSEAGDPVGNAAGQ
jgi:hypothetical protein